MPTTYIRGNIVGERKASKRVMTFLAVLGGGFLTVAVLAISAVAAHDGHVAASARVDRALKPGIARTSRFVHRSRKVERVVHWSPRVRYGRGHASLLSVPYLSKGPKNQLTPGRGNTLRVKHGPTTDHAAGKPKANVKPLTCAVPSAPGSPTATGAANQAAISWTAANGNGSTVTAYVVTAMNGATAKNAVGTPASATTTTLTGLAGANYTFAIYAISACGSGPAATTTSTTVTGGATYASTVIGLGPAAYFRLGEASGTTVAADSSGNGTLATYNTDTNITLGNAGALPSDASTSVLDNDGQWVATATSDSALPVGNAARTIQAWVKPKDANCRWVLGYGTNGTNTGYSLGECASSVAVSAYSDDLYFTTPEALTDGAWHLITVTYNGSTVTAYLDGRSLGTKTFGNPLSTGPGSALELGAYESRCCNNWTYGGLQDEAVYPTALTSAQVTSVFNASGYAVPTAPASPSASSSNNTATVTWTASSAPGTTVQGYIVTAKKGTTVQQAIATPGSATSATLTGLPSGSSTFTVTAEDAYGTGPAATTSAITIGGTATTYASTVLSNKPSVFWRLDEPVGSLLAADSSGKSITGLYSTTCITQGVTGPLANDAATGVNDSSACEPIASEAYSANLPYGSSSRTLQAWIKPNDTNCRYFMGYGGSYTDGAFAVGACYNAVLVSLYSDDHSFYSSRNIDDGNWHLVTVTDSYSSKTGNVVTAYLDGQELGTVVTGTPNTESNTGLEVGGEPYNCCYYGGVADAAVYPSALKSTAIAALMTASGNAVPTAPTGVTAGGGANKATVSWTASSAPGTTVTGYVVTELASGKPQQSLAVSGSATSATIDSLPAGSYTFQVVAYDTYGASPAGTTSGSTTVTGNTATYAGETISLKPALYFRLGETGTTIAADSSGNGDLGQYDTSGITQGISGAINDGSDLAASMNSSFMVQAGGSTLIPSGDGARTIEAWVKPSDNYCGPRWVAGFGTTSTDQAFAIGECPNEVFVDAYNDQREFFTPRSIDDGSWHFLAATYNDVGGVDQVTAYLDGKSLGTESFNGTLSTPANSTLWIGDHANDCCTAFYGGIDEAAVFPAALTSTQIGSQFTDSLDGPPAAPTGVSATAGANQATVDWTASTSPNPVTDYVVTAYSGSTPEGSVAAPASATSATVYGLPSGTYTFKVVAYDAYGASPAGTSSSASPTGTTSTYASTVLADGPVADYRLAEANGSVYAADSSPTGALATYVSGATTYGVAGAIPTDPSTAVSDNGSNSVASDQNVGDSVLPAANQPRTAVAWIKPSDTNCRYVLGWGANSTDQGFGVYTCPNQVVVTGVNDNVTFDTTTTITDGNWHQVAVTFDGTNVTAYIDGVSLGTQQFTNTNNTVTDTPLYIGAGPGDAGSVWYGALDDVAVFPTVLSSTQVGALFTASGYGVPTVPGHVVVTKGTNDATVSWNAATAPNTTITGYVVTALVGGTTAANAVATGGTATSVTLYGLKGGTAYSFQVQAVDSYGEGPGAISGSVTPTGGATTFASAVLADAPVAYYRLGEGTGSLMADSSGNGNLGHYNLSTTTLGATGALGSDTNADPSTSITENNGGGYDGAVPTGATNPLPSGSSARTVAIWIKPNDSSCRDFIGWGYTSTAEGFGLGDACDGANSIIVTGWSDDLEFTTTTNIHDGNWHFIVATVSATGVVNVYVDGASVGASQTFPTQLNTTPATELYIGSEEDAYSSWYGGLQDAAIFPTALSSSQVSTLYADR